MNQKNLFRFLAIMGVLFSIGTYFLGHQVAQETFPGLNEEGKVAVAMNQQLFAVVYLIVSLALWASRENPRALWAFSIGFLLFGINSLKHLLIDGINIPVWAAPLQLVIAGLIGYLASKEKGGM